MNKKLTSAVSLALIFAFLLVSCQGSQSPSDSDNSGASDGTDTTSPAVSRLDELGERDFGGADFVILDANGSPSLHTNIPGDESNGEIINDGLIERDRKIADMYNVNIRYVQIPNASEGASTLRSSVMAGEREYNLIYSTISGSSLGTLATEGILANLCDIGTLSLDREWWSPLIYENCRISGRMYYTGGDIAPSIYCAPACIYANQLLLNDYKIDIEEIYDKVEAGEWTLDYMNTLAGELDRDLNSDGKLVLADDFFGILNENNGLTAAAFMAGSGVKLSEISGNAITCNLSSEHSFDVIEKLSSILLNVNYNGNELHEALMNDRAVFMMHYVSSSYSRYRDMKSDFLILPIPKYDENQSTYNSLVNTWCNSFVGIPTNADPDITGFITEALAYESHENVRPLVYDLSFKNKGARNERDSDMLDIIFDSLYLDFNSFMDFGGVLSILANSIFKGADFASGYASVSEKITADAEQFVEEWTK